MCGNNQMEKEYTTGGGPKNFLNSFCNKESWRMAVQQFGEDPWAILYSQYERK